VEQLRERARSISPEERPKWLRELREQRGLMGTNRAEALARREELRRLPPAERAVRLRELREQTGQAGPAFHVLTPEEREKKRLEIKERVVKQVDLLRQRQKEGTLSDVETRRLERMEEMQKRLEQGLVLGPRGPAGAARPGGRPESDPLPPPRASVPPGTKLENTK
jgi:hypothetical protein